MQVSTEVLAVRFDLELHLYRTYTTFDVVPESDLDGTLLFLLGPPLSGQF